MKTELFDIFTPQQLQAIKDAVIYGAWGDTSQEFYGKDGQLSETHCAWGGCTNDIYKGGHFKKPEIYLWYNEWNFQEDKNREVEFYRSLFRLVGDGTGDMMFIAMDVIDARIEELEEWAKDSVLIL